MKINTPHENYTAFKRMIQDKGLVADDLLDLMSNTSIKEALEYYQEHCNCGNRLKECEEEGGFCEECR